MAKTVHPCHDRFPSTLLYLEPWLCGHDHTPCNLLTLHPALPQELWLCVYVARYMDLLYLFESFGVELIKVRHIGQLSGVHTRLVGHNALYMVTHTLHTPCMIHGHIHVVCSHTYVPCAFPPPCAVPVSTTLIVHTFHTTICRCCTSSWLSPLYCSCATRQRWLAPMTLILMSCQGLRCCYRPSYSQWCGTGCVPGGGGASSNRVVLEGGCSLDMLLC